MFYKIADLCQFAKVCMFCFTKQRRFNFCFVRFMNSHPIQIPIFVFFFASYCHSLFYSSPQEDMLQILRGLRPNITDLELHYLVEMLESRIPGKTNYFRLMEYYTKNRKQRSVSERSPRQPLLSSDSYRGNSIISFSVWLEKMYK